MAREMLLSPSEAWFEAGRATVGKSLKEEFPDGEYGEVRGAYDRVLEEMRWNNCLVTVVSKAFRPEAKEEVRVRILPYVTSLLLTPPPLSLVAGVRHALQGQPVHQKADRGLERPGEGGREAHGEE